MSIVLSASNSQIELQDLNGPEGVLLVEDAIIVANSISGKVAFYKLDQAAPFFSLYLGHNSYPHDMATSPDGQYLAVASRGSNTVSIFKKTEQAYTTTPELVLTVSTAGAVAYSQENFLVAASTYQNELRLYRYNNGIHETEPYQVLRPKNQQNLVFDGIAISNRDNTLAVACHKNNTISFYKYDSNGFYFPEPIEVLKSDHIHYPHSLIFHPITDDLVVSNASGENTLNVFSPVAANFPRYSPVPTTSLNIYKPVAADLKEKFPEEGGVKGVSFSSDGRTLALCAPELDDRTKKILIYTATW